MRLSTKRESCPATGRSVRRGAVVLPEARKYARLSEFSTEASTDSTDPAMPHVPLESTA